MRRVSVPEPPFVLQVADVIVHDDWKNSLLFTRQESKALFLKSGIKYKRLIYPNK